MAKTIPRVDVPFYHIVLLLAAFGVVAFIDIYSGIFINFASAQTAPVASCPTTYTREIPVRNPSELQTALTNAKPGDLISLTDGVYSGRFTISVSGSASQPIAICGSANAILDGGSTKSGYGFHIKNANYITLSGFSIRNSQKGIMVNGGNYNTLADLQIYSLGHEAVHFRAFSSYNTIRDSVIHDTGRRDTKYGEGVYIGSAQSNWCTYTACKPDKSDYNKVLGNTIGPNITAEEVDIKEGTTGGLVQGNTFNGIGMIASAASSWVNVKGNGYAISQNTGASSTKNGFSNHVIVSGWGNNNTFSENVANVLASGYGFWIDPSSSGNVVKCDNQVTNAASGFANRVCTP